MKILLTTLNSKYIHSCLAIRYLKSYCEDLKYDIEICEFTINQRPQYIAGEVYKTDCDVVAFSCYIWNIGSILEISKRLKIVKPDIKIILGGPEVSFDSKQILKEFPYVDFIIRGEGEETFRELVIALNEDNKRIDNINGLTFRHKDEIIQNKSRDLIKHLDSIPSPYINDLDVYKNKIVYFESSRGCPFNCKFCLSSTIDGLRFFSLDRVKRDLKRLIDARVRQVKFVDRTFNANKEYAIEIMKYLMTKNTYDINFHFEVTAHLVDNEMLDFLKNVPEGLFQFEIGVQSTNYKTIQAICRTTDFERLSYVVNTIKGYKNIHQHLDLIAGLPYEDYNTFKKSFNDVYDLRPDKLQLGFLKLLKGSSLRDDSSKYGYKFLDSPPYEVMENTYIKYDEILKLKIIEDLIEKYANDIVFKNTIEFILKNYYNRPFEFYYEFSLYWESKDFHKISHSKKRLYKIIYDFYKDNINEDIEIFNEIMKFDFLKNKEFNFPKYIKRYDIKKIKNQRHNFLKKEENSQKYVSSLAKLPTKKIINKVHFEKFSVNILQIINNDYNIKKIENQEKFILFNYVEKTRVFNKCKVYDVTKEFKKLE